MNNTLELLTQHDIEEIDKIKRIKQNITKCIPNEKLIKIILEIIEESDYFSFKNARNKKHISLTRPLFVLKAENSLKKIHKFTYNDGEETIENGRLKDIYANDVIFIQHTVQKDIVSKYSEILKDMVTNEKEFKKILKENNIDIKELKNELVEMAEFITIAMFAIKVDLKSNTIYLEYAI